MSGLLLYTEDKVVVYRKAFKNDGLHDKKKKKKKKKTLSKLGIERNLLNLTKNVYEKTKTKTRHPIATTVLTDEKLETFPLR